jgi:hypothetical protein
MNPLRRLYNWWRARQLVECLNCTGAGIVLHTVVVSLWPVGLTGPPEPPARVWRRCDACEGAGLLRRDGRKSW